MKPTRPLRHRLSLIAAVLMICALPLHADIIATDANLPTRMGAGGTASDPALYILGDTGAATVDLSSEFYWLGSDSAYNQFTIRYGSTFATGYLWMGSDETGTDNQLHITDGSTAAFNYGLEIGIAGARNHAIIDGGSTVTSYFATLGVKASSNHNSLLIDGSGSKLTLGHWMHTGLAGSDNTLTISNGGRLVSASLSYVGGGGSSDRNLATITGAGSQWRHDNYLYVGYNGGADNQILITNQGLVAVTNTIEFGTDTGNFVGLDGGYLALKGSLSYSQWKVDTMIDADRLKVLNEDGISWVTADLDDLSFDYFLNDEDALAFSGYEGLGGYMIISAATSAVPEPAACTALAGLGALALVACRRQRTRRQDRHD